MAEREEENAHISLDEIKIQIKYYLNDFYKGTKTGAYHFHLLEDYRKIMQ